MGHHHQRRRDETSHELSSFDVLGGLPSFPATTTLDASLLNPARSSQAHYACALGGEEGIASGAEAKCGIEHVCVK